MVVADGIGGFVLVGGGVPVGMMVDDGSSVGVSANGEVGARVFTVRSSDGICAVSVNARSVSCTLGFEKGRLQPLIIQPASRIKEGIIRNIRLGVFNFASPFPFYTT
jgi:hypothetical protein